MRPPTRMAAFGIGVEVPPLEQQGHIFPARLEIQDGDALHSAIAWHARTQDSLFYRCAGVILADDALRSAMPDVISEELSAATSRRGCGLDLTFKMPVAQWQLEALSASLLGRCVTSLSFDPEYEDNLPVLDFCVDADIAFPALTSLNVTHQGIETINFLKREYPRLESISIEQPSNRKVTEINLDLPELVRFSLEFVTIFDASTFAASLSRSPKLESVHFYKVWGLAVGRRSRAHRLILPSCEDISFYRSDDLDHLILWAPRLTDLNLRAAYDLESVRLVDDLEILAPLAASFGEEDAEDFAETSAIAAAATVGTSNKPPTRYKVNVINTRAGVDDEGYTKDFDGNILSHPRCRKILRDHEEEERSLYARGYGSDDENVDSDDGGELSAEEEQANAAEADQQLLRGIQEDIADPDRFDSDSDYDDDDT